MPPTEPSESNWHRLPAWLARFSEHCPGFTGRYLALDARALGLARIYLGCLLLVDLGRRVPHLKTFYTNAGLLPNHTLLWRPGAEYQFSFFFLASLSHEAAFLFALCGVVFALFAFGYRTRLFHALSFVCICSLHNRLILFDDGSETTTRLLVFWTLFLPMGQRFSLDAQRPARVEDARGASNRVVSLAVLAILLQVAVIYGFNFVHKNGETWREGSAVHYVLQQDRIVTALGFWLRSRLGLGGSRVLTYASLAIEAALPLLILSPIAQRGCRRLAITLGVGLHLGFALLLNLGLFSFNMIGFFLLLLAADDFQLMARAGTRSPRLAARFERLRAGSMRVSRGVLAFCDAPAPPAVAPLHRLLLSHAPALREAIVALFVVVLGDQLLGQNRAVPPWLRPPQPLWFRVLVEYPRLFQGWGMFAPEAPRDDMHLFVDALTIDGRHVDPLNEVASRVADTPLERIPERLGQDDMFCDYSLNIIGMQPYHGAFEQWIFAYSDRTGRENDRIVSFRVFVLEDKSPPPGSTEASDTHRRLLFEASR